VTVIAASGLSATVICSLAAAAPAPAALGVAVPPVVSS
jgi:hypothetical protein